MATKSGESKDGKVGQPGSGSRLVEAYIAKQSLEVQEVLQKLRQTIRKAAPKAEEMIKYGLPAFVQDGDLVYYGAFKAHLGFFPTGAGIEEFQDELADFKWSKGTMQFPFGQKLPLGLVTRIVKFRVKQNRERVPKTGKGKIPGKKSS